MINNIKVVNNMMWRFAERCGAQGVSFVVSIVLARLLEPEVYGTVALVTVFTTILQVFVDSGFGNALIQKKDADDLDFSSVFYFNIVMCIVLYALMFVLAPSLASFYSDESLVPIIRVLSLTLIISGIKNVQQAYVSRNMLFKRFFYATLGGTIFSAVVGIIMAYMGYGVWALVAQQMLNKLIDTLILWITVKWRPKLMFSYERLKGLLNYGWKLLASSLLDTIYNNARQLIIGVMYTTEDLAFYNKGKQFPYLIISNVNTSIDSVLLPVMSQAQNNKEQIKNMTSRAIKTSTYVIAPLMMGLAFMAPTVVELLLTETWLPCVPYLQIYCITYMFYPIHTANLNAIKAMGRSDLFLKLEILKKITGIIILVCVMWHGVMAMAYSMILSSVISQLINSYPNKKLMNYGYLQQLKDILPGMLLAILMGIVVYFVGFMPLGLIMTTIVQVLVGGIFYIVCSVVTNNESFKFLLEMIKNRRKKQ